MKMFRKLVSIVAAATVLTSSLAFSFSAQAAEVSQDAAVSSVPNIQENAADGVILHAFNWSYNSIKENLPQIAAAGYSTVQTSPVTQPKNYGMSSDVEGQWWKLYQPVSLSIAQSSWLGTKTELTELCTEADKYGIKIIVDIVANHMANDITSSGVDIPDQLGPEVKTYEPTLYNAYSTYFHSEKYKASDDNATTVTRGHVSACPDLNTANSTVQSKILALLKDCIDCGVDGFRFDAAKHIETETDSSVGSQFWVNTLDQAKTYYKSKTGKELFAYGEILNSVGGGRNLSSYTKRMRVTENKSGDNVLAGVKNGSTTQASATNYQLSGSASNAVLWAESHDTYMGESGSAGIPNTKKIADDMIIKAWAIVAARAKATALFFARPGGALMGEAAGDITYKNVAVSEVNKFHNAFANVTSEKVGVSGSMVYVARGNSGVVISNISGNAATASISGTGLADGDYVDTVTGNAFKVSGGTLSGSIGSTGVAVVYKSTSTPRAIASVESGYSFTEDTMTVQLSLENAASGTYALENSTPVSFTGTPTIRIGSDYKVGEKITLNLTATDASGQKTTNKYIYTKKASTSSGMYVFLNKSLTSGKSDFRCYIYDEDTSTTTDYVAAGWPGLEMKEDGDYLYVEVPARCLAKPKTSNTTTDSDFDLPHSPNTYVIFSWLPKNSTTRSQYPGAGVTADKKFKLQGTSHVCDAWKNTGWKTTTMTPTVVEVPATNVTQGQEIVTVPTTEQPTTIAPTTEQPTTEQPTTEQPTTVPEETVFIEKGKLGDANLDGRITITDVTTIQRYRAELLTLTGTAFELADVDRDGQVTVKDATCIQHYLAEYSDYAHVGEPYGEYGPDDPTAEKFNVTAKSNFFPEKTAKISKNESTVTVTYFMNSEKSLLETDWLLTYDSAALKPVATTGFMPKVTNAEYNTKPTSVTSGITGNASVLSLVPMKTADGKAVPFVSVTFNVLKKEDTTVNLKVKDLCVSELTDGQSASRSETDLVFDSNVRSTDSKYSLYTSVYNGSYNEGYNYSGDPSVVNPPVQPVTDPQPTDPPVTDPQPYTDPKPATRIVLFTDNQGWGQVYVYYWGGADEIEWPGVAMTLCDHDDGFGNPQYWAEVPTDITNLIFNSGKGIDDGGHQTVDIPYDDDTTGWYPTEDTDETGKNEVDSWISPDPIDPTSPIDPTDPIPPSGTRIVEFTDNKGWGQVYVHYWGGSSETEWPGIPMNKKGDNGFGGTNYWAEVPVDTTGIIFNDGQAEGGQQTADIEYNNDVTGWYPTDDKDDNGHWIVDSWTDPDPIDDPSQGRTIEFTDNQGWGTAYIYVYGADGEYAAWPGTAMTLKGENGFGGTNYTYELPGDTAFFVFNNGLPEGAEQTVDIYDDGTSTGWYPLGTKDENGHLQVGSWSEGNTSGGGSTDGFYLVGYFDGEDYWGTDHPFSGGQVTINFNETSYAFIRDAAGNAWMTNGFAGVDATSATLYSTDITGESSDKLIAPAGTVTFTLTNNGDGTFTLSTDGTGGGESVETRNIEFTNTNGWSEVYVYIYTDNGETAMWPGHLMNNIGDNGYGQQNFEYAVPTNTQFVIFNDGKGDDTGGQQTVNIPYNNDIDGWYLDGGTDEFGHFTVKYWPDGGKTILFTNNRNWSTVYCYAWDDNETKYLGEWPGTAMTNVGDNGYGQNNFSIEIPDGVQHIIFNNGAGEQTVNIDYDSSVTGWYLTGSGANDALEVASWQ